ncbi:MAG: glycosyl transferase, group 1 family protein [Bacteroidota bacterium]|nr:glycosyl transferase, group 1 family protein [Bacteroidota bacterium]
MITIAGRLIPIKRNDIAVNTVSDLVGKGLDVKLLILGSGSEEGKLKKLIASRNMLSNIFMLGHKANIEDYIASSDLLIHVSNSEASCHMPKEAGILSKPVIVCDNVGDFSDYIINGENGILIDKKNTRTELYDQLEKLYNDKSYLLKLGTSLKSTVYNKFDINRVFYMHEQLIQSMYE